MGGVITMCIISFHVHEHPTYKLVVIANRDEQYKRSTAQAHFWEDEPDILAGRDLEAMGTWMGITKQGRFAALTNYRNPNEQHPANMSRGHIVSSFLKSKGTPINFLKKLQQERHDYNGFNLIAGTVNELYFYSKQGNVIQPIEPGTYSVSNASLNTPWPKVVKARTRLESYLFKNDTVDPQILFKQLSDDTLAEDNELPDTGVGQTIEKQLSSVFIRTEGYGTKSSTVLLVTHDDEVTFMERTFKKGIYSGDLVQKHFKLA